MATSLMHETIPLTDSDCFTIFKRFKKEFDFPLHYHEEYELNFIRNAKGARRVAGDHMSEIGDWELVLIGSNLRHAWFTHHCKSDNIEEITIQFPVDLLDQKFLSRNPLSPIKAMLEDSAKGILFSQDVTMAIEPYIQGLLTKTGFESVLHLMLILHDLSLAPGSRTLSHQTFTNTPETYTTSSRRISKTLEYMNKNFSSEISLAEVARIANMTEVSFSRFFKKRTGTNFVDCLADIRLGHAARMLVDTNQNISEIAYNCGFNNISNFNRTFKKKKGCTPKEFKRDYAANGDRTYI